MHVRTTATELAHWLEREGGVWHVEGEAVLTKSLPLPTPAASLVEVLRKRAHELSSLAMLAPETSELAEGDEVGAQQISNAAHVIDGQRVFQLAWLGPDGQAQDSWLLAEQQAEVVTADSTAAARTVVAAYRAAMSRRS